MYKISKYSRVFTDIDSDNIIYNTINKAIVSIPKERFVNELCLSDCMSDDEIAYLKQNAFLDGFENLQFVEEQYEQFDTLIISLELFLKCNLSCPYCYQIGKSSKKIVSYDDLDLLAEYIQKVYDHQKFKTLAFKVLGGEPTVDWAPAKYIISKLFDFCSKSGITFKLMIDTNGTLIDSLLSLKQYHSLLLTIPLTEKESHNKNRKYPSGKGTYDDIVNNTNILSKTLDNVSIVLRYNIDNENILLFEKYITDLKERLEYTPIISPNYTMNMGGGSFCNTLNHQHLVEWRSSRFIDILAANNYPIVVTPYSLTSKCQYWSRYSLKMFSDGTVGPCAMSFWDNNRPGIRQLCDNISVTDNLWEKAKGFRLFEDAKCKKCPSLFLCGGTYNLPCSKKLGEKECENPETLHINLQPFLSRYIKYQNEGKSDLFVGFNDNNIYR